MSREQLSALLLKLENDACLSQKFQAASSVHAAVALAKEVGFDVSVDDWLNFNAAYELKELSDDELEQVAGGIVNDGSQTWPATFKNYSGGRYNQCIQCFG